MFCCVVGTIVDLKLKLAVIEDAKTKERFTCRLSGDEALEVQIGDSGAFAGRYMGGEFVIRRMAIRQFLDPLYEDDMLKTAGIVTLIPPIDDPFPEMYLRFKETEEARKANEQAQEDTEGSASPDHAEAEGALQRGSEEI